MEWNMLHTIVPRDVNPTDFWMIYDLAESYADYVLKAKLESITDEVIINESRKYSIETMGCLHRDVVDDFSEGACWAILKLLKDV